MFLLVFSLLTFSLASLSLNRVYVRISIQCEDEKYNLKKQNGPHASVPVTIHFLFFPHSLQVLCVHIPTTSIM